MLSALKERKHEPNLHSIWLKQLYPKLKTTIPKAEQPGA